MNSWALLVVPLIIAGLLGNIIPAINDYVLVENWQIGAYYGAAFIVGVLLFKNSRKEKDHEFHRVKNIKKLSKAYKAEDRGLWSKADSAMAGLERDAEGYEAFDKDLIQGKQVREIMRDKRTGEITDDEPEEEVRMLHDEEHVRRSTARMSGDMDPMAQMSGAAIEMMKSGSGQTNVDDMLAELAAEDERLSKRKKEKPAPKPKPTPAPKPKPKPKPKEVGGGEMAAAGKTTVDDLFDDLGASIGGGKSVSKETKICLDCGVRNQIGRGNCQNCGASLT